MATLPPFSITVQNPETCLGGSIIDIADLAALQYLLELLTDLVISAM